MSPDTKFILFVEEWAKKRGCTFEIETFDGREAPDLIDGMEVDDVWGWLLPDGTTEKTDDIFGCLEWSVKDGKLELHWDLCEY